MNARPPRGTDEPQLRVSGECPPPGLLATATRVCQPRPTMVAGGEGVRQAEPSRAERRAVTRPPRRQNETGKPPPPVPRSRKSAGPTPLGLEHRKRWPWRGRPAHRPVRDPGSRTAARLPVRRGRPRQGPSSTERRPNSGGADHDMTAGVFALRHRRKTLELRNRVVHDLAVGSRHRLQCAGLTPRCIDLAGDPSGVKSAVPPGGTSGIRPRRRGGGPAARRRRAAPLPV